MKHVSEPPPNDLRKATDVTPELIAITYKALAKEPASRFASAADLGVREGREDGLGGRRRQGPRGALRGRPAFAALAEGEGASRGRARDRRLHAPEGLAPALRGAPRRAVRWEGAPLLRLRRDGLLRRGPPRAPREAPPAPAGRLPVRARPTRGEGRDVGRAEARRTGGLLRVDGRREAAAALVPRAPDGQEAEPMPVGGARALKRRSRAVTLSAWNSGKVGAFSSLERAAFSGVRSFTRSKHAVRA